MRPNRFLAASLWLFLGLAPAVMAQPVEEGAEPLLAEATEPAEPTEADKLRDKVDALELRIAQIRALGSQVDTVPEGDREAIMLRRDTLGFRLIGDLSDLAESIAALPEDDPVRLDMIERLSVDYAGLVEATFDHTRDIGERIGKFTEQAQAASGTDKLVLEAYIEKLRQLRVQSYEATANLITGREALGLPVDGIREKLEAQLYVRAETLVGKLRFSGAAGEELQVRLDSDPTNTELQAAVRAFSVSHTENRKRLQIFSGLMEALGLDNRIYKAELLQQGHTISVRDFDLEVFFALAREGWKNTRESMKENAPDFIVRVVLFLIIIIVFRALSRVVSRGVRAACERSGADMSTLLKDVLASVSGGSVMLIGVFVALAQVGISVGPMLAGLGVAGFIVGFALQDTLGNFAAGGMILIYRPYDVDDFVEVQGASGLVKKMSLVSTTIATFDNQTLVVPNSKIWGDVIKNVTAQKVRRVDLVFGVSYADDLDKVDGLLHEIVEGHDKTLPKPEPLIKVHTLNESSVDFIVRPWVRTEDYWDVYWDLTKQVKQRFDAEGISIPFPQRDVHHYREDGSPGSTA